MKRFWLILLSLGLVMAFSASVFAVDVQFSGSYYAAGMYLDQVSLIKGNTPISKTVPNMDNEGTAFYFQRLRVRTDFVISPGLKLVTRFDAVERIWGGARSNPGTGGYPSTSWPSAETRAEDENIAFDWAYIEYATPVGLFMVGYMQDGATGTIFGDSYVPRGRIKYYYTAGPVTIGGDITKIQDSSYSAVNTTATYTDADANKYALEGFYQWKNGQAGTDGKAGMKIIYYKYEQNRPDPSATTPPAATLGGYVNYYYLFTPYVMANFGPAFIQAEVNYAVGMSKVYDSAVSKDIRLDNLTAFIDATVTFGPIYFGGTFAYVSGDNPGTTDRQEGGTLNGGIEWNPCLIMFNYYDRTYWVGGLPGYSGTTNVGPMSNAWFGQLNAGVRPIVPLDIKAAVAYAMADQVPTGYASDKSYGWELDVTGTYKITNNLSYMLGVGYWWVGDFYKATSNSNELRDDFIVINKLTLTF